MNDLSIIMEYIILWRNKKPKNSVWNNFSAKILFFIVPAISTALSLIFIYLYPLHREKIAEIKTTLQQKHKEKKERLLKEK